MNSRSPLHDEDDNPNQTRSTNVEIIKRLLKIKRASASGYQILEKGYDYWTYTKSGQPEGIVAYVKTGNRIVVPGLPIVGEEHLVDCLVEFQAQMDTQKIVYVGVEEEWLTILKQHGSRVDTICIGEQPEWHRQSRFETSDHTTLRSQVRRANRKGVVIEQIDTRANHPQHLHDALAKLVSEWRGRRHLATFAFMVRPEVGLNRSHAYLFVAYQAKALVGLLSCIPIPGDRGWYFEDLIRSAKAPNGTVEALVFKAFESLQTESEPFVTLGMVPLSRVDDPDCQRPILQRVLRMVRRLGKRFYNFDGLRAFKARFRPQAWQPMYMLTVNRELSLGDLLSVSRALAGGSLTWFFIRTLALKLRQQSVNFWRYAIALLVLPLVPWTVLLASCDGAYWLGSESIQWAWVTFDSLLAAGLLLLFYRIKMKQSQWMAWVLGGATLADSVLSIVQALSLHQTVTDWAFLFVLAGVLGPIFATIILFAFAWANPNPPDRTF